MGVAEEEGIVGDSHAIVHVHVDVDERRRDGRNGRRDRGNRRSTRVQLPTLLAHTPTPLHSVHARLSLEP